MKWRINCLSIHIALFSLLGVFAKAQSSPIAPKPPLGWNSFDCYSVYLHEKAAMENLEAMGKNLQPYGYEYFVIDNGWFGEYKIKLGTLYPLEKHASDVRINEHGHVIASKTYFPNGLKPIIDRCHELGLKFGIHIMRGIPRKALEMNILIKGTSLKASDIADTNPKNNCTWCTYNYGVDMSKPGAQEWYDGLIQHLADMGVDMIKYDDIVPYPMEVEAVAKAIEKTGKPILLSLSPGNNAPVEAIKSFQKAQMLRLITDPDMLACNQNGVMGKRVSQNDGIDVWKTTEKIEKMNGWVGVFNRTDRLKTFSLTPANIGLDTDFTVFNIWKGRKEHKVTAASPIEIDINPDGVLFLRYESTK